MRRGEERRARLREEGGRAHLLLPTPQAGRRSADTTAHKPDKQAAEEQKRIKTDGQITQMRQLQEERADTGTLYTAH